MTLYYLDASAWVKRHFAEAGSGWMAGFWVLRPPIASATLGLVEVLAAITRRPRLGDVPADVLHQALEQARRDHDGMISIPLDDAVMTLAADLAVQRKLRGADCVHLASAVYLREKVNVQVTIICSDQELIVAARAEGFDVINPTDDVPLPAEPT